MDFTTRLKIRLYSWLGLFVLIAAGSGALALVATLTMGFVVLCVGVLAVDVNYAVPETVTVQSHSWKRTIGVERLEVVTDSDWCTDVPPSAKILSRRSREKHRRQQRTTYADWCEFEAEAWRSARNLELDGLGTAPDPVWPAQDFVPCDQLACEREGRRTESYTVGYARADKSTNNCNLDQVSWGSVADQAPATLSFGYLTGMPVCSTLVAGAFKPKP